MSGLPQPGRFWLSRKLEDVMTSYWKMLPQGTAIITITKEDVQRLAISLGEKGLGLVTDPKFPKGEGLELRGHLLIGDEMKAFMQNGFFDEGRYFVIELDTAKVAERKGRRKPVPAEVPNV